MGPGAPGGLGCLLPHATTIVTAVCDGGVIIAGDRRSTAGNMIAKRDVEKVFRTDEFSAMGIAGTASVGLEFVRLFQVELEHYEKMEGRSLSLEGKANRLATMIRGNIAAAMQGLAVVPLFAGFDEDAGIGRIFSYDVAGGPYEEHRYHSIGSGSVFARGSLKKLYRDGMSAPDAVRACVQALYDAADDDSATGGPDLTRSIYPVIAVVTGGRLQPAVRSRGRGACPRRGRRAHAVAGRPDGPGQLGLSGAPSRLRTSQPNSRVKETPAVSMPFYVSPEQVMKDKADYARKGIARGRSGVVIQYAGGILFVAPNPSRALHKISEIYDRIAFAAVGRYNEYENLRKAGVTYADVTGYQFDRRDVTARGIANWYAQQLGTIFTESSKPFEVEIIVAEAGESAGADQIYRITFDGSVGRRARVRGHRRPGRPGGHGPEGALLRRHVADRRVQRGAGRAGRPRQRGAAGHHGTASSRWPCSTGPARTGRSAGCRAPGWRNCSAKAAPPRPARPGRRPSPPRGAARTGPSSLQRPPATTHRPARRRRTATPHHPPRLDRRGD